MDEARYLIKDLATARPALTRNIPHISAEIHPSWSCISFELLSSVLSPSSSCHTRRETGPAWQSLAPNQRKKVIIGHQFVNAD
jgi:hypothetical protein